MTDSSSNKQLAPMDKLKNMIAHPSVAQQFENCMGENKSLFVASLIDVYGSDTYLQKCDPKYVIQEALKAATLKLPINKNLGFAYIVPYQKSKKVGTAWVKEQIPQFQIGYKGYIQLAMRTGAYKYINADVVYEGELQSTDKLSGEINLNGTRTGGTIIGYFAYIETLNGFKKIMYGTKEQITAHAEKYSASFKSATSAWKTNFDEMAIKTMLRNLLSKYGVMSVEMASAFSADYDERTAEARHDDDIIEHANSDIIDIEGEDVAEAPETAKSVGPSF